MHIEGELARTTQKFASDISLCLSTMVKSSPREARFHVQDIWQIKESMNGIDESGMQSVIQISAVVM